MSKEIDYAAWYPDVPPILDTKQLAELLTTNEQIVRAYARDGVIPAHRQPVLGQSVMRLLGSSVLSSGGAILDRTVCGGGCGGYR